MTYATAKDKAVEVGYELLPYCERMNIAGSIRRRKPEVKDMEIVCCPVYEDVVDMFGNKEGLLLSPDFTRVVRGLGKRIKGQTHGKYMQIDLGSINLDLFMPDYEDYYRQFAIRTGSADYSKKIEQAWLKLGWCGSDKGLRRKNDCKKIGNDPGRTETAGMG